MSVAQVLSIRGRAEVTAVDGNALVARVVTDLRLAIAESGATITQDPLPTILGDGAVVLIIGVEEGAVVRFVFLERGRVMDEYLSVPEYHGPLPPGDVIGLGANPTVVARLTGAEPARVRDVARTARSTGDLPPAEELIGRIAEVLGVTGAEHGYAEAVGIAGAVNLPRE